MDKDKLTKVQFWIGEALKDELNEFAHSYHMATADLYKGGAILMMKLLKNPTDVTINLFTRSIKDFENAAIKKEIRKSFLKSRSVY